MAGAALGGAWELRCGRHRLQHGAYAGHAWCQAAVAACRYSSGWWSGRSRCPGSGSCPATTLEASCGCSCSRSGLRPLLHSSRCGWQGVVGSGDGCVGGTGVEVVQRVVPGGDEGGGGGAVGGVAGETEEDGALEAA